MRSAKHHYAGHVFAIARYGCYSAATEAARALQKSTTTPVMFSLSLAILDNTALSFFWHNALTSMIGGGTLWGGGVSLRNRAPYSGHVCFRIMKPPEVFFWKKIQKIYPPQLMLLPLLNLEKVLSASVQFPEGINRWFIRINPYIIFSGKPRSFRRSTDYRFSWMIFQYGDYYYRFQSFFQFFAYGIPI